MSEKGQRSHWFQFHLSTAVMLMLAAGCLLYVNMQAAPEQVQYQWVSAPNVFNPNMPTAWNPNYNFQNYGYLNTWPQAFENFGWPVAARASYYNSESGQICRSFYLSGLAIDLWMAFSILMALGTIWEVYLRRRFQFLKTSEPSESRALVRNS
jgi:hypothetical protein